MRGPKSQLTDGLMKLAEAALIDLPLAATLRVFTRDGEKDLYQAGWKAYDAVNGIAADLTNRVYASPTVGRATATVFDRTLRVQRFTDALAGAFFAALWPSVGLPTAAEVSALRQDVKALRNEVRAAMYEKESVEPARQSEDASEQVLREAEEARHAIEARRIHPGFPSPLFAGWHHLPAVEVRNRVSY